MSDFADFTSAAPLTTDFVVGYRTAVAGGERRFTLANIITLVQANTTPGSIGAATSAQGALADTALQPAAIGVTVQARSAKLDAFAALANSAGWLHNDGAGVYAWTTPTKSDVGLGNVENTALSTWAGSTSLTTLGTIGTGSWNATAIGTSKGGMLTGGSSGQVLSKASNADYDLAWIAAGGTGTVTSVALTMPSIFSVGGSPVTTSGTLAVTLGTQSANLVFAGPTNGAAATPTFRSLVAADIPDISATYLTVSAAASGYQPLEASLTALAGGSDFVQFTGPTTSTKVFTLPNATAKILTDNSAVLATEGGTGFTSYTTGNILYASSSTALTRLAPPGSSSVLTSSGTNPTWQTGISIVNVTLSGDISMTSTTGGRFSCDTQQATLSNRFAFRERTTNAALSLMGLPNGTSTTASIGVVNAAAYTNAAQMRLAVDATNCALIADTIGSGTALPMIFQTNGSTAVTISTAQAIRFHAYGAGMVISDSSGNLTAVAINPTYTTSSPTTTYTWTASATAPVQNLSLTLGGNVTLSMSGWTNGMTGVAIIKQDGTGNRTFTLPGSSKVGGAGSGAITLSTAANAIDILTVAYDGTNYYWNKILNYT